MTESTLSLCFVRKLTRRKICTNENRKQVTRNTTADWLRVRVMQLTISSALLHFQYRINNSDVVLTCLTRINSNVQFLQNVTLTALHSLFLWLKNHTYKMRCFFIWFYGINHCRIFDAKSFLYTHTHTHTHTHTYIYIYIYIWFLNIFWR